MKVNEQNIGKFVKDALKDYEVQPDAQVWQNVKQLTPAKSPFATLGAKLLYVAAALIVTGVVFWQVSSEEPSQAQELQVVEGLTIEQASSTPKHPSPTVEEISITHKENPEENKSAEPLAVVEETEKKTEADVQDISGSIDKEISKEELAELEKIDKEEQNPTIENIIESQETEIPSEENDLNLSPTEIENESEIVFLPEFSDDVTICFGSQARLLAEEGYEYAWSTGEFVSSISVSPIRSATYTVTVTNDQGQEAKHTFNVSVDENCKALILPNAFSPDGDGLNDVLHAFGNEITNFHMVIIDRNYKRIFESKDITIGWDGTYQGDLQQTGVYVCIINYTDARGNDHVLKQTVTLVR